MKLVRIFALFINLVLILSACSQIPIEDDRVAQPSADEQLTDLIERYWRDQLARNPVFATSVGVRDYDNALGDLTVAAMDAEAKAAKEFLIELEAISRDELSDKEALNARLLKRELQNTLKAQNHHGRLMLVNNRSGWHIGYAYLPERLPFFTEADYESYLVRLKKISGNNAQGIETLKKSIAVGYTQPCAPMAGYEKSISTHIVDNAEQSIFFAPFLNKPATIERERFESMQNQARSVIRESVIPAYQQLLTFYQTEYAPKCRQASGLYGLEGAEAYYQFLAERFTTTTQSPDEIHRIGLSEVKRILEEMEDVIQSTEFKGSRKEFIEFLRTDPRFYPKSDTELLYYASHLSKKADGALPKLFSRFPTMPYGVLPIPADIAEKTTTAYYERPSGDGSRAGVYRVNTSKLDTRPLFEMEALTLHEAVPGHHFQIALSQELEDIPAFRRFGGMTAFIEGWGLYAERLGLEMGFYQDPYTNFGRLSYEMWRACRLVVDTGLHSKGWTRQQAIDYMAEHTALSLHNIRSEVDRYITWPGQALAYKMGEIKIRQLRRRAEETLGQNFDVRKFHDILLAQGALPLTEIERIIEDWIAAQKT